MLNWALNGTPSLGFENLHPIVVGNYAKVEMVCSWSSLLSYAKLEARYSPVLSGLQAPGSGDMRQKKKNPKQSASTKVKFFTMKQCHKEVIKYEGSRQKDSEANLRKLPLAKDITIWALINIIISVACNPSTMFKSMSSHDIKKGKKISSSEDMREVPSNPANW